MGSPPSQPVTELLSRWSKGDNSARDALIPLVYDELRRIARRSLSSQSSGHTLQPTALVHEAYLRLARQDSVEWQNRIHFFAMAARMMRQDSCRPRAQAQRRETRRKRGRHACRGSASSRQRPNPRSAGARQCARTAWRTRSALNAASLSSDSSAGSPFRRPLKSRRFRPPPPSGNGR